ncbi:hypothetical protein DNL43_00140 [Lentilactobacillus kefiri]|uniref:hypothetical protein n=1 Tax=Lentilactobacillus kefiri TaxID=33962 RepID=UPI000BA51857|nr:hypothetical protein [Lentilactobacillus kefiri]PAK59373.1 hypothetical protein B9K02_06740 [Lentilactobacillus kefiri]QGV23823.1 hypothetical protein DNL43_00140 [Lentilactobacillus kefiri]
MIEAITITPELTKAERKLLKDLLKESKKFSDGCIPINRQEESEQKYYLHHFWKENLIWDDTMPDTPENPNGMPTYNAIKLSPDGLHYFEKYHEYKREQFLSGIVWPIIVATITSLIANMPNWLPWLIKLLK